MKTELCIPVIAGRVHLGCLPKERKKSQKVEVELKIKFKEMPEAALTDTLKNTPCYAEMSNVLKKVFKSKEFATIEYLGMNCFKDLRKYLNKFPKIKGSELHVHLNKVQPPIDAIKKGSHFSVTDIL